MDKMGSSEKAKTKGVPSSPRDGSAVELVGLQASVLRFLERSSDYPYKSVERKNANSNTIIAWSFKEWSDKVEQNFEKFFFVNENDKNPLIHKKRIYKDTVRTSSLNPCLRFLIFPLSARSQQTLRRLSIEM